MDIILKNISITCVRCSTDTILITPKNITMGIWPFNGNPIFKTEVPTGHAEKWLVENFGKEILKFLKIIEDK
jgi:hypothetical protein